MDSKINYYLHRILDMDPVTFGEKLRQYRRQNDLSQTEVAKVFYAKDLENTLQTKGEGAKSKLLASKQRQIGRIESGDNSISKEELCALESALEKLSTEKGRRQSFIEFANEKINPWGEIIPSRNELVKQHMDFLTHEANMGKYELFFTNGESIPMYGSSELKGTWTELIRAGVNYHVLWDVHRIGTERGKTVFSRKFWKEIERIAKELESDEEPQKRNAYLKTKTEDRETDLRFQGFDGDRSVSGIDVYPFYFGFALNRDNTATKRGLEVYEQYMDDVKKLSPFIRLHKPFPVEVVPEEFWRLLVDTSYLSVATAFYVPCPYRSGEIFAHMEPERITTDFYDREEFEAHIFLGDRAVSVLGDMIVPFEKWHSKNVAENADEWRAGFEGKQ